MIYHLPPIRKKDIQQKRRQTASVGEDVEKLGPNVVLLKKKNRRNTLGKSWTISYKVYTFTL